MTEDIARIRLHNQQLISPNYKRPAQIVQWFGAMQAQDYAAAKWAIALRSKDLTDADIEQAFNAGEILRTHIMRPTWHFVTPADIRWLLALTAPRVKRFNGYYYRQSGLDKTIFEKGNAVIKNALQGGKQLTRTELKSELDRHKVPTENLGLTYTIMQAELDGVVCSGGRLGKQFTYMLLDERAPKTEEISQEEALAKLIKRYLQSHGPAQLQDFVWWSGLTMSDAKKGMEFIKSEVRIEEKNGKTYWSLEAIKKSNDSHDALLIPGFDEYFIAYKDRSDILDKKYAKQLNQGGGMINGAILAEGKMIGGWKRTFAKGNVIITMELFEKGSASLEHALEKQAKRYGEFINMPVSFDIRFIPK